MFGLNLRNLCPRRAPTRLDVGWERQPLVGVDSLRRWSRAGARPLLIPLGHAQEDTLTRFPKVRCSRFSLLSPMIDKLLTEFWQCSPQHLGHVRYVLPFILLANPKPIPIRPKYFPSIIENNEIRLAQHSFHVHHRGWALAANIYPQHHQSPMPNNIIRFADIPPDSQNLAAALQPN